jgi:hypothetical protein
VPAADGARIIINQRMLFYFERFAAAYPIAAGQPTWRTPLGEFKIV